MRPFDLTSQALAMITTHWKSLLAVLLPIYAVQWAALHLIERAMSRAVDGLVVRDAQGFLAVWFGGLGLVLAWSLGAALLAVLWHRLVLRPGAVWPPLSAFGWYVREAIKLSLLLAILSWAVLALFSLLMSIAPDLMLDVLWLLWLFSLAISTFAAWLWLRFGLILPAAALGEDTMTMVTSWFETEDAVWSILVLAALQGAIWSGISAFDAWSRWSGAEFFLWPIPVLLGLAALSVLYRDRETRAPDA